MVEPGLYRHFKGGLYRVLFTAKDSETTEETVVYQALYGNREIWVRPARMWDETVVRDGIEYKRFVKVGDCEE